MSEFDIRIGTQLDTSKALQQLMEFVKKYDNKEKINIDIGQTKGANNIKNTTKAMKEMQKIAKALGSTKIDIGGNIGKATGEATKSLENSIDKQAKSIAKITSNAQRDLTKDAQKGIGNSLKGINAEMKDTQRNVDRMISTLERAKKVELIDQKGLDEGLAKLKDMKANLNIGNIDNVEKKLGEVANDYKKLMTDATKEAFNNVEVSGLLEDLKVVREAMSAKNMDLSGVDALISKAKQLTSLSVDQMLQQYKELRQVFSKELKIPLGLSGIMNAETAIKNVLDYKNKLTAKVSVETNSEQVDILKDKIVRCDEVVEQLRGDLNLVGRSTALNLMEQANGRELDTLSAKLKKCKNDYASLEKERERLNKDSRYLGTEDLNNIEKQSLAIKKNLDSLNVGNLNTDKINKVTGDIDNLRKTIESTGNSAKKLDIEATVKVDMKNAQDQLNGMYSALIKSNKSTVMVKKYKDELEGLFDLSKTNPGVALDKISGFIEKVNKEAKNKGLGKITGGLDQYKQYLKDYESLVKKASGTTDIGFAKAYKSEVTQIEKALDQLESGFNQTQKSMAKSLRLESINKNTQEFTNQVEKSIKKTQEYKKELQTLNNDVNFDGLTSKLGQKVKEEFDGMINKTNQLEKRLGNMLSSGNINTTELSKLKSELESTFSGLSKLKDTSIKIKTDETVSGLNKIKKDLETLGQDTSQIERVINVLKELKANFNGGTAGYKELANGIKSIGKDNNLEKLNSSLEKSVKKFNNLAKAVGELKVKNISNIDQGAFQSLDSQVARIQSHIEGLNKNDISLIDVKKVEAEVNELSNCVEKMSSELTQYSKYLEEYKRLSSQAGKTNDVNLATKYQQEAEGIKGVLTQLESEFTQAQKSIAQGLKTDAFSNANEKMSSEINKSIKTVDNLKEKLNTLDKDVHFENMTSELGKELNSQFDTLANKGEELKDKLNKILASDNVDISALSKIKKEISEFASEVNNLKNSAMDNVIRESFDNIKIPNLNKQLEAVKDLMSLKNMDTSGIDTLIERTKKLSSLSVDKIGQEFKEIQNALGKEINLRLGSSGIKDIESALKVILQYRNELKNKIAVETDSSKVKDLNNQLEKTENIIEKLKGQTSGGLGASLISDANNNNLKQLEDTANGLEKTFSNLENEVNKLNSEALNKVDISQLREMNEVVNDVKKNLASIGEGNVNVDSINKTAQDIEKLKRLIENTKKTISDMKLEVSFNIKSNEAEQYLAGFESALLRLGKSTSGINDLKSEFESIKNSANGNLSSAIKMIDDFINKLKQMGSKQGLGNISGTISQYKQYAKELQQAMSGALKSSGSDTAKGFEQQADRIKNAMQRLTSSFKESQRESANAFNSSSFSGFSSKYEAEINKVEKSINRFKSSMQNLDKAVNFKSFQSDVGRGLSEQFDQIMAKAEQLRDKLKSALSSGTFDISEINRIKDELKQVEQEADSLKQKSIVLKCAESISELEKLSSKLRDIGGDTSQIDRLRDEFVSLGSGIKEGTAGIDDAISKLKSLSSEAQRTFSSFESSTGKIGSFGSKIQGFFGSIKDSFRNFTIGELMADGINQAVYQIKDTISGLDEAMSEFKRVAPDNFSLNTSNLQSVANEAREIGISVGQSVEDVITGMSTALQAGAGNIKTASEIAKSSAIFQNVTDMDAKSASKAISSMVNQYYDMDSALNQVDHGVGKSVKGYNNLTEAMDLVIDLPFILEII